MGRTTDVEFLFGAAPRYQYSWMVQVGERRHHEYRAIGGAVVQLSINGTWTERETGLSADLEGDVAQVPKSLVIDRSPPSPHYCHYLNFSCIE
jgi:hypothetical protein